MPRKKYDIRTASLTQFRDFVFDHEVRDAKNVPWYQDENLVIAFDPAHNAIRFSEMFQNARSLLRKYDSATLEQGYWAMFGGGFEGNLPDLIWNREIGLNLKVTMIRSMYFLYEDVFATAPRSEASFMWWDEIAYDIHPLELADPENNTEHYAIREAMFETLEKILMIDSWHCQEAALHGFNHVQHPETATVVQQFIDENPGLTNDQIKYAVSCANGLSL